MVGGSLSGSSFFEVYNLFIDESENCPAPSNTCGYSIAKNIYSLAHPFGVVKLLKAYLETDQFKSITFRSELQSSGVSLVDCPHNGRKEVADKMILGWESSKSQLVWRC